MIFFPGWWDFHPVNQGCGALWCHLASFRGVFACENCWSPRWSKNTWSCRRPSSCYKWGWNDSRLVSLRLCYLHGSIGLHFRLVLSLCDIYRQILHFFSFRHLKHQNYFLLLLFCTDMFQLKEDIKSQVVRAFMLLASCRIPIEKMGSVTMLPENLEVRMCQVGIFSFSVWIRVFLYPLSPIYSSVFTLLNSLRFQVSFRS